VSPYKRTIPSDAQVALDNLKHVLAIWRTATDIATTELAKAVATCLDAGATWGEVGACFGVTKQGARSHWSPYIEQLKSHDPG